MASKYYVYVVELSKSVWSESEKFRNANPQYNGVLECLYVGQSSKKPEIRFKQHKEGTLSKKGYSLASSVVKKYGLYLRPSLCQDYNPKSRKEALEMEEELALELRRKRYAVWYG